MKDCVFCKIIAGDIPSEVLYRDENMIIIRDIDPKAKLHYLAIPTVHYRLLSEMSAEDGQTLGKIFGEIARLAPALGLQNGYRLIVNQGEDAGQTVHHVHIHILGGQPMDFPGL